MGSLGPQCLARSGSSLTLLEAFAEIHTCCSFCRKALPSPPGLPGKLPKCPLRLSSPSTRSLSTPAQTEVPREHLASSSHTPRSHCLSPDCEAQGQGPCQGCARCPADLHRHSGHSWGQWSQQGGQPQLLAGQAHRARVPRTARVKRALDAWGHFWEIFQRAV